MKFLKRWIRLTNGNGNNPQHQALYRLQRDATEGEVQDSQRDV